MAIGPLKRATVWTAEWIMLRELVRLLEDLSQSLEKGKVKVSVSVRCCLKMYEILASWKLRGRRGSEGVEKRARMRERGWTRGFEPGRE